MFKNTDLSVENFVTSAVKKCIKVFATGELITNVNVNDDKNSYGERSQSL